MISIDYKPTVLIAENAPAITYGFVSAYTNISSICCLVHAIRNIDIYLKPIKNEQSVEFLKTLLMNDKTTLIFI